MKNENINGNQDIVTKMYVDFNMWYKLATDAQFSSFNRCAEVIKH